MEIKEALEVIETGLAFDDLITEYEERALTEVKKALDRTRWIPVSERLPEEKDANEFGYVLVVTRYGSIRTDKAEWVADKEGRKFFTHWMPLPEPPQGVE